MLSKKFLSSYFLTILIISVLANFSFTLYISLFNPDLPKNEVALAQALKSWQQGLSYLNILLLASMVVIGFLYIFHGFKKSKVKS
jgi:hypothetical protein